MKNSLRLILFWVLCPVAAFVWAGVEPQWEDTLQEITVVNARMKAQQQSLSSPVTTLHLKQMEQEQRLTFKDMSALVPNLYVPDYGSKMTSSVYLRGLGARIDNPVLGICVDGVGLANKNSYDFDLFDIRSLSLYRGPQGTLFGRNTIGGVLQVQTLSPLDWQGTRATVGYGNYNTAEVKLSHYHLLQKNASDSASVSPHEWGIGAAAYYRHTDGCFRNEFDGSRVDAVHEAGARVKMDGRNERGYRNSTFLSYNFVEQTGFPYHLPRQGINHNDYCGYNRHNFVFGSSYQFPLSGYLLGGTTSYQLLHDRMQMDQDFLPLPYFTLQQNQREHYVSQELTLRPQKHALSAETDKRLSWDWLTGVQISYKHNRMTAPVHFLQTGIDSLILKNANKGIHTAFPEAQMVIQEDNFFVNSSFLTQVAEVAAYHTSFLTVGNWHIEAGLRMEFEYQHFRYLSDGQVHYKVENTAITDYRAVNSKVQGVVGLPFFEVLPKLAATYQRKKQNSGWQASLSVSEGYKAGGFNTQLFSDILQNTMMQDMMHDMGVSFAEEQDYTVSEVITYKPERCLNIEAGLAGNWRQDDIRLDGSMTLYELEVFNQQLTVFPERGTGRFMTNAGRSRSMGVELTGRLQWRQLSVETGYGYTYAVFVRYNNGKNDFAGKQVPYVPSHTISAAVNYRIPFRHRFFHVLNLNVNTQAFGPIFWNEENTEKQSLYALLNANLTLQMKYVSVGLWAKNLTQTRYEVFRFVSMGNTLMQSGKPLTFGGKISIEI